MANSLGYGDDTQAVMYSGIGRAMEYMGLTADDVNMVRYGMTGADRIAGTTDDHTYALAYQNTCAGVDLVVRVQPLTGSVPGGCKAQTALSFSQPGLKLHYSMVPHAEETTWIVVMDENRPWDHGDAIFLGSFEGGHLLEWSSVVGP